MIKNVQVIHAVYATAEEIAAMKAAGSSISLAPTSELRIGFGLPPTTAFLDAGIPVGLSVDTVELVGNADMFAIMKTVQGIENGQAESEFKLSARRVVELATIEGARSMGIDDKVGSLKAGQARRPHHGRHARRQSRRVRRSGRDAGDGGAARPMSIPCMVDGRILKRNGKLTAMNVALIAKEAAEANVAVRKRANWW